MMSKAACLSAGLCFLSFLPSGGDTTATGRKLQPVLPPHLEFASEIMDTLQAAGLDTFAVIPEKLLPLFSADERKVLLLTNEKRMITVYFFPGESDAEQLSITYTRIHEKGKHHRYRIDGWPVGAGATLETFQPLYFTLHGPWLIQTAEPQLDILIKKSLSEAGPAAEPPRQPCPEPRITRP